MALKMRSRGHNCNEMRCPVLTAVSCSCLCRHCAVTCLYLETALLCTCATDDSCSATMTAPAQQHGHTAFRCYSRGAREPSERAR